MRLCLRDGMVMAHGVNSGMRCGVWAFCWGERHSGQQCVMVDVCPVAVLVELWQGGMSAVG